MTMKKLRLSLWVIALAALSESAAHAQDVVGTWQGTLQGPQAALRIVMQVSIGENQALKAVMFSIDQGGQPISASEVKVDGPAVKITVAAIGGVFEGRLGGGGTTLAGTWSQGASTPFTMTKATPATAWAIPEPPPPAKPMAADAKLEFEVATIKPSDPSAPGQSILVGRGGGNLFTTTNTTLHDLIVFAYGVHPRQLTGLPSWAETDKYDLTGKPEQPGIPNATQLRTMVQKLLTERFGMVFHNEKRELSAYTITVGKNGPKLSKNESGGNLPGFGGRGPGAIGVRNSSMQEFAGFLQARILDRPVVDRTGLAGKYDFTLEWRPDQVQAGPNPPQLPPEVEARPDLFGAIQEQLGLKLEATKTPVDVMVVDKVQKPSDN
jgi:uncharacterized protein (TIGR03435 family)